MSWAQTLAVVFHVLVAVGIIALVLLQRGKGADAGAGFGAGASGTVFGSRGSASFLSRTTAVLATLFFVSSLVLSYLFSQGVGPSSVVDRVKTQESATVPPLTGTGAQLPSSPTTPASSAPPPTAPAALPAPAPATAGQPQQQAPATPAQ
jgi:preprotein translocase subunit SecG